MGRRRIDGKREGKKAGRMQVRKEMIHDNKEVSEHIKEKEQMGNIGVNIY